MRILTGLSFILLLLPLSGCQTENSSASDAQLYSGGGTPAFNEARSIMAANCTGCHTYHTMTEEQLVTAGVLVKGDPDNSQIYYRLTGSSGSQGPKTMPPTGSLSVSQVASIRDWISAAQ